MNSLSGKDKALFEKLLRMHTGYVLDFTNRTFSTFVQEVAGVDIFQDQYAVNGSSKANRLRTFWTLEPDVVVGRLLTALVDYARSCPVDDVPYRAQLLDICTRVADRLGAPPVRPQEELDFLRSDLSGVAIADAVPAPDLATLLEARLDEARRCIDNECNLAAVILCGSVLEGLLLGAARAQPKAFNGATGAPKEKDGKTRAFRSWSLAQLIDVAYELGMVGLDVQKHSHSLRDFRNFIHPSEHLKARFTPDGYTAQIALQVVRAAAACLKRARQ